MQRKHRRGLVAAAFVAGLGLIASTASAALPGSTFEGNDGNYVPNGGVDWTTVAGLVIGNDLTTGQGDSSLGGGTAENDTTVKVGFGSIPNSKADLSQFLVASEQGANGHTYLYLGWTRNNQGGTTNFDFEINKVEQPDMTTAGTKILNRTVGDLLINYLFQGQGTPVVEIRTWTGTVWSAPTAGVVAEAAISSASQANPFGLPNPVPAAQFGETSIDLTASGIIGEGECEGFSSAYVKSRSSTSFNSELKDFVPPQHVDINNCATIIVEKVTVPSPDPTDTSFSFTSDFADPLTFSLKNGESKTTEDLNPGTYSVSETVPANWALTSATCDDGSDPSAIDLDAQETVTCTFTNTLQTGAILIHKDRKHAAEGPGDHPHAGVAFSVEGVAAGNTDADGNICVDGLLFGTYTVDETVPAGYVSDDASKDVVVDNTATCDQDPYVGETVNFVNTPLTNVSVSVDSQVPGGTSSTISCDDGSSAGPGDDISLSLTDEEPQTLVCTIVIDP